MLRRSWIRFSLRTRGDALAREVWFAPVYVGDPINSFSVRLWRHRSCRNTDHLTHGTQSCPGNLCLVQAALVLLVGAVALALLQRPRVFLSTTKSAASAN